jgi:phosphatidylinositol alpha-1,6-mannosyltransferase
MRVLLLATDVYGGNGGIALYNRDLAEAIALHPKCEEIVVLPRLVPGELEPIPPRVTFLANAAKSQLAYLSTLSSLMRKRDSFDIVICGHMNLMPFARQITRHPTLFIYGIEAWKRSPRLTARAARELRAVVSISEITRRRFNAWSHAQCQSHLLPNAIRLEDYGIRPRSKELIERYHLENKRVLLTLGRLAALERYKGFDEVIEVLPSLPEDVVYIVAGSGKDGDRLRAKAAALGVSGRVVFTGFVPEEQKADLYGIADAYVMPSHGEGFGFVLLEAMASGVPAIASRMDGGYEAVRNGKLAITVDPSNPAEIRAAILETLANPRRDIPPGLEYFSFERFVERTHAILDTIQGTWTAH